MTLPRQQVTHVSNPKIGTQTSPGTYYIPTTFACAETSGRLWYWSYHFLSIQRDGTIVYAVLFP